MSTFDKILLNELIQKELDGVLVDAEFDQLQSILKQSDEAVVYYSKSIVLFSMFQDSDSAGMYSKSFFGNNHDNLENSDILKALAEDEQLAESIELQKEIEDTCISEFEIGNIKHTKFEKLNKVYNIIVTIAAVFMMLFIVYANMFQFQLTVPVATVIDQINIEWDRSSEQLKNDDRVLTNQLSYQIATGIIEVEYDKGVNVIIEGPAKFHFERAGVFLEYGQLYSDVSESGIGFRVDTPTCQFIDLGTEFGIKADVDGSSEMHVVKGKVQMYAGGQFGSKTISEYSARRFSSSSAEVNNIVFDSEKFIRHIDSDSAMVWRGEMSIDLADIVGGGNGFGSGNTGVWLNLKSGREGTALIDNPQQMSRYTLEELSVIEKRVTDNIYKQVVHSPYIDGIFSPDGGMGDVQVSSQGDYWSECPDTSGIYFEDIYNGSHIGTSYSHKLVLDGKVYGTKDKPAIALHSNAGITFDLKAIRADMPVVMIKSFEAKCGISEEDRQSGSIANIYVLVDSEIRYQSLGMQSSYAPGEISIDLREDDSYLTLVVTDCDMRANNDWAFFAMPRIVIE